MEVKDKEIAKILNVPSDKTVRTIIPFGVPLNEVKQNSKKDLMKEWCGINSNHYILKGKK